MASRESSAARYEESEEHVVDRMLHTEYVENSVSYHADFAMRMRDGRRLVPPGKLRWAEARAAEVVAKLKVKNGGWTHRRRLALGPVLQARANAAPKVTRYELLQEARLHSGSATSSSHLWKSRHAQAKAEVACKRRLGKGPPPTLRPASRA